MDMATPLTQRFEPGWVVASYVISCLGALTTLILLKNKSARHGLRKWTTLSLASVALGGIAIFCMHFLGNRAIIVSGAQGRTQLHYSSAIVIASFILPTVVIFMAFIMMGATDEKDRYRWVKLIFGGTLGGGAVVGMHYCGEAAIDNLIVSFRPGFVIGSVVIALVATNVALVIFFILRRLWQDSWSRLFGLALLIAAAVTSMHFTAAAGTVYHYKAGTDAITSTSTYRGLLIFVLVVSCSACLILITYALLDMYRIAKRRARASKIVLVTAVFDDSGRILVNDVDGTLPSQLVTDTYVEYTMADSFDTSSYMYRWLFEASAHFRLVAPLIPHMRSAVKRRLQETAVHDLSRQEFSKLFRQQFCISARDLADRVNIPLQNMGLCYDKILVTGGGDSTEAPLIDGKKLTEVDIQDLEMSRPARRRLDRLRSKRSSPQGHVIFLVKHLVESERPGSATKRNWRFAPLDTALHAAAQGLNLEQSVVESSLRDMQASYKLDKLSWVPDKTYVAYFGAQARVAGGFRVVVPDNARGILPNVELNLTAKLTSNQQAEIARLHDLTMLDAAARCIADPTAHADIGEGPGASVNAFSRELAAAISSLAEIVGASAAAEARLLALSPIVVPCGQAYPNGTATLLVFRHTIPIDTNATAVAQSIGTLSYVDYGTFNGYHRAASDPHAAAFAQQLGVEFQTYSPLLDSEDEGDVCDGDEESGVGLREIPSAAAAAAVDKTSNPLGIFVHEAVSVTTTTSPGKKSSRTMAPRFSSLANPATHSHTRTRTDSGSERLLSQVAPPFALSPPSRGGESIGGITDAMGIDLTESRPHEIHLVGHSVARGTVTKSPGDSPIEPTWCDILLRSEASYRPSSLQLVRPPAVNKP
ncbi:hypothetical protein PYCC9005_001339 [Savitreella phatthalungensis]